MRTRENLCDLLFWGRGGELSIHSYVQKKMFLVSNLFWRCFWKNALEPGVNVPLFFKIKKEKKKLWQK